MDLYTKTAYVLAQKLTRDYSTSFSSSSRLFSPAIQPHIYAIYGMVRIADEIVDTYQGVDVLEQLDAFEQAVYRTVAMKAPFSTNPIIHAFASTAKEYGIDRSLIEPFFTSMRTDITKTSFNQKEYAAYIYGSAEVIGLMCLRVFCAGDETRYTKLLPGARALGSAYQKVNFLRDIAADYAERGRWYFPVGAFETFSEADKAHIENDISRDFEAARPAIAHLPPSARRATQLSYRYYRELFATLQKTPAEALKHRRVRVPNTKKLQLLAATWIHA